MQVNGNQVSFSDVKDGRTPTNAINEEKLRLAGSKHVEWFTNKQIIDGDARALGFISSPYQNSNILQLFDLSNQMGGLMITNESGVTYHFALPVYSYSERARTFRGDDPNNIYQENNNVHPYAYMWLLTAITGPDYVDRNDNGLVDDVDWGYWVKFEYGKWTDNYKWRNPSIGFHEDIDKKVKFFSQGVREVYYLNAISTKTHVALFVKEIRNDAKGLAVQSNDGVFGALKVQQDGTDCEYYQKSASSMKLTRILLMEKAKLGTSVSEICKSGGAYTGTIPSCLNGTQPASPHFGLNVLDESDLNTISLGNSLRSINFQTDYSLCKGVPNSFLSGGLYQENPLVPVERTGKLTLRALAFGGKGLVSTLPPMRFVYDKNPVYNKDAYDVWGLYKSDYRNTSYENESLRRMTTEVSSHDVDAWSLSRIYTSQGSVIHIWYESDEYKKVALFKSTSFRIKDAVDAGSGKLKLTFYESAYEASLDFREMFSIGGSVKTYIQGYHKRRKATLYVDDTKVCNYPSNCISAECAAAEFFEFNSENSTIAEVGKDYLIIDDSKLYTDLYADKTTLIYDNENEDGKKGAYVYCDDKWSVVFYPRVSARFTGYPDKISGGYIGVESDRVRKGGGCRVSSIKVESLYESKTTKYTYEGGVTSYEPFGFLPPALDPPTAYYTENNDAEQAYNVSMYRNFSKVFGLSREVPAPGVLYSKVTIEEEIEHAGQTEAIELPGKRVLAFQTFDPSYVERAPMVEISPGVFSPLTINDFSSRTGLLKSTSTYGSDNVLLQKVENIYLHDQVEDFKAAISDRYGNQGVITQIFNESRVNENVLNHVFSRKTEYPVVYVGEKVKNYKTAIERTTENLAFDFITGSVVKTLSVDSYGNRYITEVTPAYRIEEYSGMSTLQISNNIVGMGLKINNPKNKHMLTQVAKTVVSKVNNANEFQGLAAATVNTWSDEIPVVGSESLLAEATASKGIWRSHANYNFVGDAKTVVDGDGLFDTNVSFSSWSRGSDVPAGWNKSSEVSLYNTASQPLEELNINNITSAVRTTLDHSRVIASAQNASYSEFGFSGAEEQALNGWGDNVMPATENYSTTAHTGSRSIVANAGQRGFQFTALTKKKRYLLNFWASKTNCIARTKVNGVVTTLPLNVKGKAGDWYLLETTVDISTETNVEFWTEASENNTLMDDFRVHPVTAIVTTFVYNSWGELSFILDNDNLYTKFEYDATGKLISTYRETFSHGVKKVSEYKYEYISTN